MEYGRQLEIRVEAVQDELESLPRREDFDLAWLVRYRAIESTLSALHRSIYNSGMLDGAFVAHLDDTLVAARAQIKALR